MDPLGLANYPTNIDFIDHPDLFPATGNQKNIVKIMLQASRTRDFTQAYKEAGIPRSAASDYTWRHVHDFDPATSESTMQLVQRTTHESTLPHKGSADQFARYFGVEYDSDAAVQAAEGKGWLKGRKPKTTTAAPTSCAF